LTSSVVSSKIQCLLQVYTFVAAVCDNRPGGKQPFFNTTYPPTLVIIHMKVVKSWLFTGNQK
jgi:hypothetical protein